MEGNSCTYVLNNHLCLSNKKIRNETTANLAQLNATLKSKQHSCLFFIVIIPLIVQWLVWSRSSTFTSAFFMCDIAGRTTTTTKKKKTRLFDCQNNIRSSMNSLKNICLKMCKLSLFVLIMNNGPATYLGWYLKLIGWLLLYEPH